MNKKNELMKRIFLSVQKALLGNVGKELRALKIEFLEKEKELLLNFYFESKISETNTELIHEIGTEVIANFTENEISKVNEKGIIYSYPKPLNLLPGITLYQRYE